MIRGAPRPSEGDRATDAARRPSRRAGRVHGAGAAVAAATAVALLGAALLARSVFAGAYGSGPYSFPHQPHLSPAAVAASLAEPPPFRPGEGRTGPGGTADRECRVCHDYTKGDDVHVGSCAQCHVDSAHLETEVLPAPEGPRFPHAAHLKDPQLTCFSCHRARKELGWLEFTIPPAGLGVAGVDGRPGGPDGELSCADCHRAHEPKGGLVAADDVTGDGKQCAACHSVPGAILPLRYRPGAGTAAAAAARPFLHADHGGGGGDCERCHAGVRGSRSIWDYDPTKGTAAACAECHVDAAGKPLVGVGSPPRTTKLPSVMFSRFPHDAHMAPPKGEIEVSGRVTDGCRTCHFPEKDSAAWRLFPGRTVSDEPIGRDTLVDYDTCVPCHSTWKVEGHGVGAWACFKCHSGAADAEGRLDMGRSEVVRDSLAGGVRFAGHDHPGVCAAAAPLANPAESAVGKSCRDCHVADLQSLPSRLGGRTFLHDPHLPANPTRADCVACHTTSATTSWSADLARFDPHFDAPVTLTGAAGRARGCLSCHVGATREELGLSKLRRTVPEFDHRSHGTAKWKGEAGVPCGECHTRGGTTGYETPADVSDCTRCHSHDEKKTEQFARTGKKSSAGADAAACRHCHEEVREQGTPTVPAPRTHLSLLPGRQHHDQGGACAGCHARDDRPYEYAERVKKAKVAKSIHEDPAFCDEWFNDPAIAKAGKDPQGRTCMTCHRFEPRGYLRALGGAR